MQTLDKLQSYLVENNFSQIFLLTDNITTEKCLPILVEKVEEISDRQATLLEIPTGEENKNLQTAIDIINSLSESQADVNSCLISLGGGMITDLGGFVCSIYKRGIKNINVPTTLLSMIDASIGGKTAVNHNGIKNLIGTFNFKSEIFIDTDFLLSLSFEQIKDGMAEMLKTFLVYNEDLANNFMENIKNIETNKDFLSCNEDFIKRCAEIKEQIVKKDAYDKNIRKILNFGHTFGHAIESFYHLSHGHSVAIGMIYAIRLSIKYCNFPNYKAEKIINFLKYYFPLPDYDKDIQQLKELMLQDKKNSLQNINFVLLNDIAEPVIYPFKN